MDNWKSTLEEIDCNLRGSSSTDKYDQSQASALQCLFGSDGEIKPTARKNSW